MVRRGRFLTQSQGTRGTRCRNIDVISTLAKTVDVGMGPAEDYFVGYSAVSVSVAVELGVTKRACHAQVI